MTTLFITRGLPGSGKSTWAREQREADDEVTLVSRDDIRRMLFGGWTSKPEDEATVTAVQSAVITTLLNRGLNVYCHDTNLHADHLAQLEWIARAAGARTFVVDFFNVPLETCIERDAARPWPEEVGADVIRRMHERYLAASS